MEKVKKLFRWVMTSASIMVMTMGASAVPVYAKKQKTYKHKIAKSFYDLFNDIKIDLMYFSSAAAGVCIVTCLLILLFTKNEKATQSAWDWLKRIVICYFAIMSVGAIVGFIENFEISN